jgi:Amino acid permease
LSVRGAAFLGIGAMVGAGIFALLGEAGAVAGAAVWLSFLLAGIVAGLLGYTVVKLGVRFPSSGGLIAYLREGFGNGRLVGIASWLGYFAAIVIVCSMVAVAFGSYACSLFIGEDAASGWDNVFTSAVVLGMLAVNLIGSRVVDRAQSATTLRRPARCDPRSWPRPDRRLLCHYIPLRGAASVRHRCRPAWGGRPARSGLGQWVTLTSSKCSWPPLTTFSLISPTPGA